MTQIKAKTNNNHERLGSTKQITKHDDFFIAIGKINTHSFVMLGVMQNEKPVMLACVGKETPREEMGFTLFGRAIFSHVNTWLGGSSLKPSGEISYIAYAISYEHYVNFIHLMRLAKHPRRGIYCYQPKSEDGDEITLEYSDIERDCSVGPDTDMQRTLLDRAGKLHINNTCRHTAIDIVEYIQGTKISEHVSRNFFWDLPLKTEFQKGEPKDNFYVFPLPPTFYKVDEKKAVVLTKIYKRMEDLIKISPYDDLTKAKFKALKELYHEQAGCLASGDIHHALDSIHEWKTAHLEMIGQLRHKYFFDQLFRRRTSTIIMVDELECALNAADNSL